MTSADQPPGDDALAGVFDEPALPKQAVAGPDDHEQDEESLPEAKLDIMTLLTGDDETNKTKQIRRIPGLALEAWRMVWRAARWRAVVVAGLQAVSGLGLGAQLLAGNQLLNQALAVRARAGDLAELVSDALVFGLVAGGLALVAALVSSQMSVLRELVSTHANGEIMSAAASAELTDFENSEFYNQLQRASVGGEIRPTIMVQGVLGLVSSLLGCVGVGLALASLAPELVPLAVLAAVPAAVAAIRNAKSGFVMVMGNTADNRERQYLRQVLTERESAKEVRSFNLVGYLRRRHDVVSERILQRVKRDARANLRRTLLGTGLGGLVGVAAGAVLLWLLVQGRLPVAAAATAALGLQQLRSRVGLVGFGLSGIFEAALYLEDYRAFVARAAARPRRDLPAVGAFTTLAARGAEFRYPGSPRAALSDVDVEIRAGEVVALVGENGSGKTTLAKLLSGLYLPTAGSVTWDGQDITEVDRASVHEQTTVIFQDFVRYALPARDNVGLGRHQEIDDDARVREAVRLAGLERVFDRLPDGWDTVLGPQFSGGQDLSGGQWQRVALARAFFRDASFLVLDEPTAALDARAEHRLFQRLRELATGKSVLLITHRFGNVRMADRIYVLHQGRVVEHGSHDELMAADGRYAELFRLQAAQFLSTTG